MAASPARTPPRSTADREIDFTKGGHGRDQFDGLYNDSNWHNLFHSAPPSSLTGEMWNLIFHCEDANPDKVCIKESNLDRADINYFNLVCMKSKLGYGGRDFMYYKKRCGNDVARLELIDYEEDAVSMLQNNQRERKVRIVFCRDQAEELQVSITPMKRPREPKGSDQQCRQEPIDEYKVWLANLQDSANEQDDASEEDEQPHPEFKDDYRLETIKTYREWLSHRRELANILSYVQEDVDGVHTNLEDENPECNSSPIERPSHARLPKKNGKGGGKNYGRGTLKGLSVATKRIKSGTQKLQIDFSEKRGGPIGDNARAFIDEVVTFTRKRAPLIGVRSWKDIKQNVKNSIASDILNRWVFQNTENAKEKIWDIASERYRGWRSTFSSTFKAYNSYDERMKKKPEDLDIVEWHYLILYFGTEKFQKVSQKNAENRKQQKTKHLMGSKPFSQYSYEQRDPETGEEPSDLRLFKMTHTKNGEWSNAVSKSVFEKANDKICLTAIEEERLPTAEEEDIIFQSTYKETIGCRMSKPHGHGYLAKYPTRRQLMNDKIEEQARVSAATHQRNIELEGKIEKLEGQLANEVAERDRILEEYRQQIREEEQKAREALQEQMRAEMLSMLAQQKQTSQQTNPESNIEREHVDVRKTGISNVSKRNHANASTTFISSHQLRSAAKGRPRARSELDDTI